MSNPLIHSHLLRSAGLLLSSAAVLLTGCALQQTASEGNAFVPDAVLSGQIHGGQQPVAGATVQLYAVGTSGYGTGATLLATTTSATGSGGFSFTQKSTQVGPDNPVDASYGCPTSSSLLYIVASGGDPTGANTGTLYNANIKMMAALGACSGQASTFTNVNEVSTVLSVAALQQYISPFTTTVNIGSPSTTGSGSKMSAATTGIANAFALVTSMYSGAAGVANATYAPSSSVGTITATLEAAKVYTIADIIAACINTTGSASSQCSTLMSAATPPTIPSATNFASSYTPAITAADTLQATLFMLQNPTDAGTQISSCAFSSTATTNMTCLYAAQTASAPYPGLTATAPPNDWTIGVTYASNSVTTVGTGTAAVLAYPEFLAIDKSGNVWIATGVSTAVTPTSAKASLVELSPQGGTLAQVLDTGQLFGPQQLAIDPSGNVWVPNFGYSSTTSSSNTVGYGTTVVEYPFSGSPAAGNSYAVGGCPYGVASDGAGNIFVGDCSVTLVNSTGNPTSTTPGAQVSEILSGAPAGTSTPISTSATTYSATVYSAIAVDSNFTVWTTADSGAVFAFPLTTSAYSTSLTNTTNVTDAASISIDNSNDAWIGNYAATATVGVSELAISGTPSAITKVTGSPFSTALAKTSYSAIDGAQNTWITEQTSSSGPVVAFAHNGAQLVPAAGFSHTYYYPTGIAIDPSGNVWIGNDASPTRTAVAGYTATGGYVTEIIGAAVPVVTPIAAGLPATAGGTSFLATTPK